MILADVIRRRAAALGWPLGHVDDDELGARLVAMPLEVTDDPRAAVLWLSFATDPAEIRRVLAVRGQG